jgi:RNA polymerase sigma factor (sigma-70 family)
MMILKRQSRKRIRRLKKLWLRYTGMRNRLFEYYWKWARSIGKMFASKYKIRFDDIETDVSLGLLNAIENSRMRITNDFDDTDFKHYATSAIRSSIIDGIKDMKSVRVSQPNIHNFIKMTGQSISNKRMKLIKDEVYTIKEYVKKLPQFEKNLIYRRYFLEEKLSVIGKDLGMSVPIVCVKCKEILNKMIEETGIEPIG